MSDDPSEGVTKPTGEVHGCPGLYVNDGSLLCTSVGVNPAATIAAIAERNVLAFIRGRISSDWGKEDALKVRRPGEQEYLQQVRDAAAWRLNAEKHGWALTPPPAPDLPFRHQAIGLEFKEVLFGYHDQAAAFPGTEDQYRQLESRGRPRHPVRLNLTAKVDNLARFFEDMTHEMTLSGSVTICLPGESEARTFEGVSGRLELIVARHKPYGIGAKDTVRLAAQQRWRGGRRYRTKRGRPRRGTRRLMQYQVWFHDEIFEREWELVGYKLMRDDPGFDAWRDTSALFITLLERPARRARRPMPRPKRDDADVRAAGVAHADLSEFLFEQLPSTKIIGGDGQPMQDDAPQALWARAKFGAFFFGSLQRIYAPEIGATIETLFRPKSDNVRLEP